jgi:prepilin-type N-terminal cleavage/methylation domain-containing protein
MAPRRIRVFDVRRASFTLVEIMTVLTILGVLLLLALPDMDASSRTYLLQSGASEVMSGLQFAQAEAIATGVSHGCEFTTGTNSFFCFDATGGAPYSPAVHPVKKTAYSMDFDTAPGFGGVVLSAVTFTDGRVIFDSLGSPDFGGTVTVSLSGFSKNVDVSPISGLMEFSDP